VAEPPLLEKKGKMQQNQKTKEEEVFNLESTTEEQQEKLAIAVSETNDERMVSFNEQPQGQRKNRNIIRKNKKASR
jgi:hypothetical protein